MPIRSKSQYGLMQAAAHGKLRGIGGPSKEVAKEFIDKTPAKKRSNFAKFINKGK